MKFDTIAEIYAEVVKVHETDAELIKGQKTGVFKTDKQRFALAAERVSREHCNRQFQETFINTLWQRYVKDCMTTLGDVFMPSNFGKV
jgi:hypothetical protein